MTEWTILGVKADGTSTVGHWIADGTDPVLTIKDRYESGWLQAILIRDGVEVGWIVEVDGKRTWSAETKETTIRKSDIRNDDRTWWAEGFASSEAPHDVTGMEPVRPENGQP